MVFASIIFIFLFLPLVLASYYIVPKKLRNLHLLCASIVFYFWGENFLLWILLTSSMIDYFCGLVISCGGKTGEIDIVNQHSPKTTRQQLGLAVSIFSNLGFLFYFKYFNFYIDNVCLVADLFGVYYINSYIRVILPLGISFYTFQSMSYTIDVYRGEIRATRNVVDFLSYVTLFPQLVAGPIVRYRDIHQQLTSRKTGLSDLRLGVQRFITGFIKKILIANSMAKVADGIFAIPSDQLSFSLSWLGAVAYSLQIYFDFSGYSDMAIGLGRMFGFRYLENFNYPYISKSIRDFWRRWHISLSTWFRDYLYIPLGGNRKGSLRTYFNQITVFLLCGFWHGAEWTFVIWGLYHGFFLAIERAGLGKALNRIPAALRYVYSLVVVIVGWVIFRSNNFTQAASYLKTMFNPFADVPQIYQVGQFMQGDALAALVAGIFFSTPLYKYFLDRFQVGVSIIEKDDKHLRSNRMLSNLFESVNLVVLFYLFFLAMAAIATGSYNPFIYFRF